MFLLFFLPSLFFIIIIITFISTSTQSKEADTATIIYLVGTQLVYFSERAGKLLQE